MKNLLCLIFLAVTHVFSNLVWADSCYETSVKSPAPYLNNGGEIVIMIDGTIWQDASYNYSYACQYYPTVTICPSSGFMVMNGKKIAIIPVSGGTPKQSNKQKTDRTSPTVIESQIDGEFSGWEGETIFKLMNGQIWQQSSYAYTYHYAYSPSVLIVLTRSGYVMQVDGVSSKINVTRIR